MTITTFWSRDKLNRKEDGQYIDYPLFIISIFSI